MTEQVETAAIGDTKRVEKSWFEHGTTRIYYEECGSGDPVLMLPGWSMSIEGFSMLRDVLATAGYRVIAADLPGSGRSEPQPRTYTVNYFEDDARAFAALLQHLAVGPAHLIGFSDGGEDALLMAALLPNAVRSVVTWGAAGLLSDPSGQLREAMYNLVDQPIPPLKGFRDYLVGAYGESNARAMSQSMVTALSAIMESRGGDLSLSKAGSIVCPVLLITGEHDMFVPMALISQFAARAGAAEAVEAKGAGHDVHNALPEWTAQTVLDWLKQH
jgi:pimeloyl-ACP methyl ester carboxylesterase